MDKQSIVHALVFRTQKKRVDFIKLAIMLKILLHLKLFYRRFFDNKYKMGSNSVFWGLKELKKRKDSLLFLYDFGFFKPFLT